MFSEMVCHPVERIVEVARRVAPQSSRKTLLVQGWGIAPAACLSATSSVPAVVVRAVVACSNTMLSVLTADAAPMVVACSNRMLLDPASAPDRWIVMSQVPAAQVAAPAYCCD